MARKINKTAILSIHGIAHNGHAVGRTEQGMVVFVEGAVPGDVVEVVLLRKRKGSWHGRVLNILTPSENRTQAFCDHFGICGGCSWQHLNYAAQMEFKSGWVKDAVQRIAKLEDDTIFEDPMPAEEIRFYRNKLEFTFSAHKWFIASDKGLKEENEQNCALGFHRPGHFSKVVDIQRCFLQSEPSNEIRNYIRQLALEQEYSFYDIKKHEGFLRTLIIRNTLDGNVQCIISVGQEDPKKLEMIVESTVKSFPQIRSFYSVLNTKWNDSLSDLTFKLEYGDAYLTETLDHVRFLIGPKSFFQTNTRQAAQLYRQVEAYANLSGKETVLDLYCGVGSIGIYLARKAAKVIGIEEIPEAIADAVMNAQANQLNHCHFMVSDAKELLWSEFKEKHGLPDLVIVDPPRTGLHEQVCESLLQLGAQKIIYVSCNPATQARDLSLLAGSYKLEKIKAVDLFPHTNHVESVALLSLRQ